MAGLGTASKASHGRESRIVPCVCNVCRLQAGKRAGGRWRCHIQPRVFCHPATVNPFFQPPARAAVTCVVSAYRQRFAIRCTDKCKCPGLWSPAAQASACCKATQVIRQNRAGAHGIDPGFRARIICQCGDIAGGKNILMRQGLQCGANRNHAGGATALTRNTASNS